MARIKKILHMEDKGDYALIHVQLETGDEPYVVYVGGDVEAYFAKGRLNAFVKKEVR